MGGIRHQAAQLQGERLMPKRAISNPALELLIESGQLWELPNLARTNLFTFILRGGATTHRWTNWNSDIPWDGHTYLAGPPFLKRTRWNVTNTMQVPEMTVELLALNGSFNGGADIKTQIRNGLFSGATFVLDDLIMPSDRSLWGTGEIFGGVVAGVTIEGAKVTITIRGKNNLLDQYSPRAIYQGPCFHAFCDAGCALNAAAYTATYTVGSSPSAIFIPWASAPANPELYIAGQLTMTDGAAAGQKRDIVFADSSGLTLEYPLYDMPLAGDGFDALEGCNYFELSQGDGRIYADRSNQQHFFGFLNIPPPTTQY